MIKKHLYWDITLHFSEYPEPIKKQFNKIYFNKRKSFVFWLDRISMNFQEDLDWWVSSPSSRNLYYSDLYKYICVLKTLDKLKTKYSFSVITDSQAFKKILIKSFNSNILKVKIKLSKKLISKYFYFFYIIKNILLFFLQYSLIKIIIKKNYIPNNISLIDTFIIDKKNKEKFYYGNLKNLAIKQNKKVFFLTTIIENNFIKFFNILNSLNKSKDYFLKENYLNYRDLFYCFLYLNRKKKFDINYKKFEKFNLSSLIKEEIFYNRNLFSVFIGLSNYRFFKKMKLKSLNIKKFVNWFENQPFDKGLNYGLRKFYPNAISLGYQGFTDYPEYMNIYPSNAEFKSNVIPKKIVVCGEKYINLRKEFCKKLNIINGPALRAENVHKFSEKKRIYKVVIFLEGASKKMDRDIVLKFIDISKSFIDTKFYIKTHPILPINKLEVNIPNNVKVISGNFSSVAEKTLIAISYGNTSATLESLAYGCNLIIPYNNYFDKKNLKNFGVNKDYFKVCSNKLDIIKTIKFFLNKKNSKKFRNRKKIKNILFNKVNKKTLSVIL